MAADSIVMLNFLVDGTIMLCEIIYGFTNIGCIRCAPIQYRT